MSKFRFGVLVVTITGMFFACGALTQDPSDMGTVITAGVFCSLLPIGGFIVGYLAWRNAWTLGITPDRE